MEFTSILFKPVTSMSMKINTHRSHFEFKRFGKFIISKGALKK